MLSSHTWAVPGAICRTKVPCRRPACGVIAIAIRERALRRSRDASLLEVAVAPAELEYAVQMAPLAVRIGIAERCLDGLRQGHREAMLPIV